MSCDATDDDGTILWESQRQSCRSEFPRTERRLEFERWNRTVSIGAPVWLEVYPPPFPWPDEARSILYASRTPASHASTWLPYRPGSNLLSTREDQLQSSFIATEM